MSLLLNNLNANLNPNRNTASFAEVYGEPPLLTERASHTHDLNQSIKNHTTTTALAAIAQHRQITPLPSDLVHSENITLSSRAIKAQQFQIIAQDFFKRGQFSITDIPALLSRLKQDAILSPAQLARFSSKVGEMPEAALSVHSLTGFVSEAQTALASDDPLHSVLSQVDNVLTNMSEAQSVSIAYQATEAYTKLQNYLNTDPKLSAPSQRQWQGLTLMMQITSAMGEHQSAQGQLSSYLALAKPHKSS